MITITDEELNTSGQPDADPRYTVRDNSGNVIYDNVKIELKTPVDVAGTPINKATLEGIQTDLLSETALIVADYTTTSDVTEVEFTDLDIDSDGGMYEIWINGDINGGTYVFMQINDIVTQTYYNTDSSTSTDTAFRIADVGDSVLVNMSIAIETREGGYKILGRSTTGHTHFMTSMAIQGTLAESNNLTKIKILGSSSIFKIRTGTHFRIIKRR